MQQNNGSGLIPPHIIAAYFVGAAGLVASLVGLNASMQGGAGVFQGPAIQSLGLALLVFAVVVRGGSR